MPVILRLALPALAAAGALFRPLAAPAVPVVIEIDNYFVAIGKRADYFNGKFLTAEDFNQEQSYKKGTDHYLGPSDLPLDELFDPVGHAGVFLVFDDTDAASGNRSDPADANNPHREDVIFLYPEQGTWRGRLYLDDVAGIGTGVYDNLAGSFDRLVAIDEPGGAALLGLGLAALWMMRRRAVPVTAVRDLP